MSLTERTHQDHRASIAQTPHMDTVTVNIKLENSKRVKMELQASSNLMDVWAELSNAQHVQTSDMYDFLDPVSKTTYNRENWSETLHAIGFTASSKMKQLLLVPSASAAPSVMVITKLLLQCHISSMLRAQDDAFEQLQNPNTWSASALILLLKSIESKERSRIAALQLVAYPFDLDSDSQTLVNKMFQENIKDVASRVRHVPLSTCELTLPDCRFHLIASFLHTTSL